MKYHKNSQLVRSALPLALAKMLELDNTLQILSFAGLVATDSAKVSYGVATNIRNWLQIGYNFEMYKKEKSRKSLTYRTHFLGASGWA